MLMWLSWTLRFEGGEMLTCCWCLSWSLRWDKGLLYVLYMFFVFKKCLNSLISPFDSQVRAIITFTDLIPEGSKAAKSASQQFPTKRCIKSNQTPLILDTEYITSIDLSLWRSIIQNKRSVSCSTSWYHLSSDLKTNRNRHQHVSK